ncbi:MAG: hypothetical protein Tsb0034_07000 [Ekhidna sp.]
MQFLFAGTLDRIQKALEKQELEKAEELILKGYEKEPENPGIPFYHATLLFNASYQSYQPDSARRAVNSALHLFENASEDRKAELADEGITREKIELLATKIKDFLFRQTLSELTISNIDRFMQHYPGSVYDDILTYKRDSINFDRAVSLNTETGFLSFIEERPTSVFKPKADSLLDGLRFQRLRATGTLKDYRAFLATYPLTRFEEEVEAYILKISAAAHQVSNYTDFIKTARSASMLKKAGDLLYFLEPKTGTRFHPFQDSIQMVSEANTKTLFPVMDETSFGFHDVNGIEQIPYSYDDVAWQHKCTAVTDSWLFVQKEGEGLIINRENRIIASGVLDYQDPGHGVALVTHQDGIYLYHKSGFRILEQPIEEAEVLMEKWIKIKSAGKWGLYTFLGLPIADARYDDIYTAGPFWVFERQGLLGVYTEKLILDEIEERGLSLEFKFEDIELVDSTMLIGFRGDRECLMDIDLNFLIPWGVHEIYPEPSGWYLRTEQGYKIYNNTDERVINRNYPYLESNSGWLALKTEEDWMLIPRKGTLQPTRGYDSLKVVSPNATLTFKDDEIKLLFINGSSLDLDEHQVKAYPRHPDYISITNEGALGIYNAAGKLVFDGKFQQATFINDSLLKISSRSKQGLIHVNGEFVLNPLFESIDEKDGLILTLLRGKIGCYDLASKTYIKPEYESRIEKIGAHFLVKKGSKFGLIEARGKNILDFKYDEIKYWNDSSYLVKMNGLHRIIDGHGEPLTEPLDQLSLLFENDKRSIYRFVRNGKFGLLSNQQGLILSPEFTEIINIGSDEAPLFFADQHLSHAGYHVVSYLNESGKVVFSKAYRKDVFERIICDE